MTEATHIDTTAAPSGTGCQECESRGAWWVHLRRCAACSHVGCCDSSPGQHATAHFRETGHELMRSFEPGEDWYWNFRTEATVTGPDLAPPTSHPVDQPAPGPAGRVPADWLDHIHR
ncbi:UBP-type zinc finger domain-containing protein [Occultella gossypii]|uniref:UBP-type zinc finger domain-containing protein n=1 Tax=Occultella gossypii TaxID=2800820 RepID=A0ABS7SHR2_9MICO|nr:UBP-type zinc finger domain-containing protein [Occultella gossypii]MBZ2198836.1 UBP-type zinc finger domain-containing protein [Occultella gossypii]